SDAARGPSTPSFDHLVGERKQVVGDPEAERFRRPQVDHKLEPGGQHDRQIARPGAVEDAPDISPDLPVYVDDVDAVASLIWRSDGGKLGFARKPIVRADGTRSCSRPSRLGSNIVVSTFTPVALAPGRLKLVANPSLIGSLLIPNTIGIAEVASLAASTDTGMRHSSSANAFWLSNCPRPRRCSILTFCPAMRPASRGPGRNAVARCGASWAPGVLS